MGSAQTGRKGAMESLAAVRAPAPPAPQTRLSIVLFFACFSLRGFPKFPVDVDRTRELYAQADLAFLLPRTARYQGGGGVNTVFNFFAQDEVRRHSLPPEKS